MQFKIEHDYPIPLLFSKHFFNGIVVFFYPKKCFWLLSSTASDWWDFVAPWKKPQKITAKLYFSTNKKPSFYKRGGGFCIQQRTKDLLIFQLFFETHSRKPRQLCWKIENLLGWRKFLRSLFFAGKNVSVHKIWGFFRGKTVHSFG